MSRETCTIEANNGITLDARIFKPATTQQEEAPETSLAIVLVHPYSVLGGCQGLMKGIARGLSNRGFLSVTFDMRGVGKSTGRASLTGSSEIRDIIAVCKWVCQNLAANRILLVGSSAGAPIAGSAVDQIEEVVGYVSLGYPFGLTASILFRGHHKAILQSPKPKLFVMGTRDGFTSVKQLENKLKSAAGRTETHLIEGVSHFQMEGPAYDAQMVELIIGFIRSLSDPSSTTRPRYFTS
ncbi:alpha/beta-Hydrolases superfamily protein [Actinidia rufa]|uniref:Alpha/beta-Hydrolases superfamily protein n=1 Tax=Actinidia rufa TaxID=165716 RepID=A0A7J0DKZ7_9ERIC|nr:alpha/beta-Hydrolases superfamily protein [Actinidia rufa]